MSPSSVSPTRKLVKRFRDALVEDFRRLGLGEVEVQYELLSGTKLVRLYVIADKFNRLLHSERQRVVWRVADEVFTEAQCRKISMILTLASGE